MDAYEPPVDVQDEGIQFENQDFLYVEQFLKTTAANGLVGYCLRDIDWHRESVTMF